MSEPLDKTSMIIALTDGAGAEFGGTSRKSFYAQLERLERSTRFQKASHEHQQSLVDLLAVAAFYQNVIVPIESSGNFISVLNRAGASHLRVAKDRLGKEFSTRSRSATQKFWQIIGRAGIPAHLLSYATMDQFVGAVIRHYSGGDK